MNITVSQSNLHLLLPSKISWMADMLIDDNNLCVVDAVKSIYSSNTYNRLEDEDTKAWHLGPVALYEEYLEETSF